MIKKISLLLTASLLMALAGCGGGGGGSSISQGPQPPTGLHVVSRTGNVPVNIVLAWVAPTDDTVSFFRIYRKISGEPSFTEAGVTSSSEVSFTDSLSANLTVEYRVVSANSNGVESKPNGPVLSQAPSIPAAPTDLGVVDRQLTSPLVVTVYWTAVADNSVVQYGIYRRMLGEMTFSKVATVPASQASYTDLLTKNLDAEFQVVSINSNGLESAPLGPIFSEAPLPGPPS